MNREPAGNPAVAEAATGRTARAARAARPADSGTG